MCCSLLFLPPASGKTHPYVHQGQGEHRDMDKGEGQRVPRQPGVDAVCVQLAWVQAVGNNHLALSCTEKIINSWEHHAGLILHIFRYINVMVVSSNCCIFLLT